MSPAPAAAGNGARDAAALEAQRARICFVVSSPMTVEAFLTESIRALSERYDVHLALNADAHSIRHPALRSVTVHRVRIERAISPLRDLLALLDLVRLLRSGGFDAVHSVTPKAGLIAAIAGFVSRVPVRVHTFTGQVWATRKGGSRALLKALDRVIARLTTHVLVDSASQRDFLRAQGVLHASQGLVLGYGSVSGVDVRRFRPDAASREAVRRELSIPPSARVFLFIGRLTRDKGVLDLASAFEHVSRELDAAFLICVGPDEEALAPAIRTRCGLAASRVRFVSWTVAPERFIAASDVCCLPSYREGFGSVVIEAAAAGVPAIGSRIYGIVDAIEDGTTGLLVAVGNVPALGAAMSRLATDDALRDSMGQAARTRALRDFSRETLTAALVAFYERALARTEDPSRQERLRSRFDEP